MNTEQLHIKYNIIPLNISIHCKAQQTWETIRMSGNAQYEDLIIGRNKKNTRGSLRALSTIINMEEPQLIIT